MRYPSPFIIEHLSFGVYCGMRESPATSKLRPHFKLEASRVAPAVKRMATYEEALVELRKVQAFHRWRKAYVHKLGTDGGPYSPSMARGRP